MQTKCYIPTRIGWSCAVAREHKNKGTQRHNNNIFNCINKHWQLAGERAVSVFFFYRFLSQPSGSCSLRALGV